VRDGHVDTTSAGVFFAQSFSMIGRHILQSHHEYVEMNVINPAVGNSSPFLTNLPFHDFSNYFNHESWFTFLGKIVKRQVCQKGG